MNGVNHHKLHIIVAFLALLLPSVPAFAETASLAARLPKSANAVMTIDVEKLIQSPVGKELGLQSKLLSGYADRPLAVPATAKRVAIATDRGGDESGQSGRRLVQDGLHTDECAAEVDRFNLRRLGRATTDGRDDRLDGARIADEPNDLVDRRSVAIRGVNAERRDGQIEWFESAGLEIVAEGGQAVEVGMDGMPIRRSGPSNESSDDCVVRQAAVHEHSRCSCDQRTKLWFGAAAPKVALDHSTDTRGGEGVDDVEEHRVRRAPQRRRINDQTGRLRSQAKGVVESFLELVAGEKRKAETRRDDLGERRLACAGSATHDHEPRAARRAHSWCSLRSSISQAWSRACQAMR